MKRERHVFISALMHAGASFADTAADVADVKAMLDRFVANLAARIGRAERCSLVDRFERELREPLDERTADRSHPLWLSCRQRARLCALVKARPFYFAPPTFDSNP